MADSDSNYILSRDGLKLYYRIKEVNDVKAVICLFHGHGEHSGRYVGLMNELAESGIASIAFDFRGHGHSDGKRGHLPSLDHVLSDIEEGVKFARLNFLESPIFIFGQSFGGCMVLNYVLKKPKLELSGFIASNPWLSLVFEPPKWKTQLGDLLSNVLPAFSLPSGLDPQLISKDQSVIDAFKNDDLVHSKISAKFFSETMLAGKHVVENAGSIELPGLIYHGEQDQVVDFHTTQSLALPADVEFHSLENVYHEPHNDVEKDQVYGIVNNWILSFIDK